MEDISKTDYKPAMKSNYSSDLKAGGWSKDGGSDSRELDDLHPTELPPAFSAYEANYRVRGDGHVITHDEHLNEDGMWLCPLKKEFNLLVMLCQTDGNCFCSNGFRP